jgi:hypothetical protein
MMKKLFKFFVAAILLTGISFFQACGEGNDESEIQKMDTDAEKELDRQEMATKVRKVLYSIPSPIETATLVKSSGVEFNAHSMSDPNKVGDYNTTKSQAFNLGIYGSDLAYSSIFEQSQEALNYFSAVKLLADELSVSTIINEDNISRFERNIENRDSLMVFVNEIFWAIDATLAEDERGYVSAIVMAGGWVEAVYILLKNGKDIEGVDQERVKQILADQHFSLENILKLTEAYEDEENLVSIKAEMKKINELFSRIEREDNETKVNTDVSGKVVIGGNDLVTISDELYNEIYNEVNTFRSKYVN